MRAAAVVVLALTIDLALGDPPNRWHPVAWIGRALRAGGNRARGGSAFRLLAGGAVVLVTVAAGAAVAAWAISLASMTLGLAGIALEALVLKSTLAVRGLARAAGDVASALARGHLPAARALVGFHLVSRPTDELEAGAVASASVESVAENLTDSLVAPLCFYAVFGLPGAAVYRVVNTADALIGYRHGELEHLGKAAARLDDLCNLVPARLAALVLVVAALLAGADARGAWRVMRRDHRRTASPNAGWTIAAMAGALGVTLEKRSAYRIGTGRVPDAGDIVQSVVILRWAAAISAGLVVVGLTLGTVGR